MRLTRVRVPEGFPAGSYARSGRDLYVEAQSPSNRGVWFRCATDTERKRWSDLGWDVTFDCRRPEGAGGGWMRSTEILPVTPA